MPKQPIHVNIYFNNSRSNKAEQDTEGIVPCRQPSEPIRCHSIVSITEVEQHFDFA